MNKLSNVDLMYILIFTLASIALVVKLLHTIFYPIP